MLTLVNKNIVRNNYLKFLNREPDEEGWNHYVHLMDIKEIDEDKLIELFKNSPEYKLSYPVEMDKNTPIDIKMKKDWDARAKMDHLFVIATGHSNSEEDFWNSGIDNSKKILGVGTQRFQKIIKNINTPQNGTKKQPTPNELAQAVRDLGLSNG